MAGSLYVESEWKVVTGKNKDGLEGWDFETHTPT